MGDADPRNLQLKDRGIIDKIFTDDIAAELRSIILSPPAAPIIAKFLNGQRVTPREVFGVITPQQQRRLQGLLLYNVNKLLEDFESDFDPLLASVFSFGVPAINPETESIWAAPISDLVDDHYNLEALVHDAAGNPVDQIQQTFTVDTTAPEADISIEPADTNTVGYLNSEGTYVATTRNLGPVMLKIIGTPKPAYAGQGVGIDEGYLSYQQVSLDAYGMPKSTWMPLTVQNTMLTSRLWLELLERGGDGVVSVLKQLFPIQVGGLNDAAILGLAQATNPKQIVDTLISAELIQNSANAFFKNVGLGFKLTDAEACNDIRCLRCFDKNR